MEIDELVDQCNLILTHRPDLLNLIAKILTLEVKRLTSNTEDIEKEVYKLKQQFCLTNATWSKQIQEKAAIVIVDAFLYAAMFQTDLQQAYPHRTLSNGEFLFKLGVEQQRNWKRECVVCWEYEIHQEIIILRPCGHSACLSCFQDCCSQLDEQCPSCAVSIQTAFNTNESALSVESTIIMFGLQKLAH